MKTHPVPTKAFLKLSPNKAMFYLNPLSHGPKGHCRKWHHKLEFSWRVYSSYTTILDISGRGKLCHVIQWLCLVYQLEHQPMNCFKKFENRRFGNYTIAIVLKQYWNSNGIALDLHKCRIIVTNTYVTGPEKRGHFVQIPNFGFKMLITLKL